MTEKDTLWNRFIEEICDRDAETLSPVQKTPRQATADILKEHGVESKADMDRLSEEDGAKLYEALKAGVLEEYDITPKQLERLVEQILK